MSALIERGWMLAWIGLSLFLQSTLNIQLRKMEAPWVQPAEETQRKWDPRLFQVFSLGQLPAALDWVWLRALMDPNIFHVPRGIHPKLYYDLELLTDLDPAFRSAYIVGANLLAVIRNDGLGAKNLLEKGKRFRDESLPGYPKRFIEKYWSNPWTLSLLLAYVYLFELQDMPHAALEFRAASQGPGAPPYLIRLAKRLEAPGGEYEVGLKLLDFMMSEAREERVMDRLKAQKRSLQISQFLFEVNDEFKRFQSEQLSLPKEEAWERFVLQKKGSSEDPWGGRLGLNDQGKVVSSTPRESVLGLE